MVQKEETFLELIEDCDCFPYSVTEDIGQFLVKNQLVGYIRHHVAVRLISEFPQLFTSLHTSRGLSEIKVAQTDVQTSEELTKILNNVAQVLREKEAFEVLKGWRDEQYSVYGKGGEVLFTLERAACALFGLVTYGAHLNAYIPADGTNPIRMWCPRRAKNKATFPGMLDNSVAGGISNGLSAYETIIKEAGEEASIPEDTARALVHCVGAISYIYVDGTVESGAGYVQPEVQYVYDLPLTSKFADLKLRPNDGEAEDFKLWTLDQVREEMLRGNFKPNCAAVIIDFMIRHGYITPENEPQYLNLIKRLHRSLPFPLW